MKIVDDFVEISGVPCPRRTYFDAQGRERMRETLIGGGYYRTVMKPKKEDPSNPDFAYIAFLLRSY